MHGRELAVWVVMGNLIGNGMDEEKIVLGRYAARRQLLLVYLESFDLVIDLWNIAIKISFVLHFIVRGEGDGSTSDDRTGLGGRPATWCRSLVP
jgi:hypothetical protein